MTAWYSEIFVQLIQGDFKGTLEKEWKRRYGGKIIAFKKETSGLYKIIGTEIAISINGESNIDSIFTRIELIL